MLFFSASPSLTSECIILCAKIVSLGKTKPFQKYHYSCMGDKLHCSSACRFQNSVTTAELLTNDISHYLLCYIIADDNGAHRNRRVSVVESSGAALSIWVGISCWGLVNC